MTAWRDYQPTVDDVIASCEANAEQAARDERVWRERRSRCMAGTKELAEAQLEVARHFHERRHWSAMADWYHRNRDKPMLTFGAVAARAQREPGQEG